MTIAYVAHVADEREHDEITKANMAQDDIHFLTDFRMGDYYDEQICGMDYQGVIISDQARISESSLLYLLSRVRNEGELFVQLGDYHKDLMERFYTNQWIGNNLAWSKYLSEEEMIELRNWDRKFCLILGITPTF
jgi:hypothetical protein